MKKMTFAEAINDALFVAMEKDPKTVFYALGADDPKRLFGTAEGLVEKFGEERVFDMPTAENGMTGVGVGLALQGFRPIMTHLRLDFFLLAMDQVVNSAAKWHYMFGGQDTVPITIRLVLGRGWGQGPTHCQNLQTWFAHVPGLKVVMPATAADAKGLLLSSIKDENPVVFMEHRWLHNQVGEVAEGEVLEPLGKAKVVRSGTDVTLVAYSYMVIEALHAAEELEKQGVSCEVVDLRTVAPIDWETVNNSVKKTGHLVAMDTSAYKLSIGSEIVSECSIKCFDQLKTAPQKVASPDYPVPTSFGLTEQFYPRASEIMDAVAKVVGKDINTAEVLEKQKKYPHDVPGDWFTGPF